MFAGPDSKMERITMLAQGGMGTVEVVRFRQGPIERLCAVKRVHRQFAEDEHFLAMFRQEARLAGLLRHPNVVSVLATGNDAEGPFLRMDYVEGISASQLLRRLATTRAVLPISLAVEIARQTAEGLAAAHELVDAEGRALGLIHRDVSPQNILLGVDGVVRLTDFGIAKSLDSTTGTNTGFLKGKQGYLSPEQLQYRELDQRTDLFALGVVLFELLTSRRLYRGSMSEAARAILSDPVPDIVDQREEVPDEIAELLFELLAKEPADRPARTRDVAERLRSIGVGLLEPTQTLRDYIVDHFSEELEARRAEIHTAISDLRRQPSVTPGRKLRRRGAAAAAVMITAAVGFWAAVTWSKTPHGDARPTAPAAAPGATATLRDVAPTTAQKGPQETATTHDGVESIASSNEPPDEPHAAGEPEATPASDPSARVRGRTRSRQSRSSTTMNQRAVGLLEW